MPALYLTKDLFFASRVTATARSLGGEVRVVGSAKELLADGGSDAPLVLIDLDTPGVAVSEIVTGLQKQDGASPTIIAFGSHVHEARLQAAQEAGCDAVLTRGQFDRQMSEILRAHLGDTA